MTVSLLIFSALMSSHILASTGSAGSIHCSFSRSSLPAGLCKAALLLLGSQCYRARRRQINSPLQVSRAIDLLTVLNKVCRVLPPLWLAVERVKRRAGAVILSSFECSQSVGDQLGITISARAGVEQAV